MGNFELSSFSKHIYTKDCKHSDQQDWVWWVRKFKNDQIFEFPWGQLLVTQVKMKIGQC